MGSGARRPGEAAAAPGEAGAAGAGTTADRGTLYVVSTPIGNLGDVTLRAIDVLRSVPLVAAEDTRLTRRLFARHGIETRMVSYHARNAERRESELLAHLASGADLALVTDAGTPLVSDPGEGIVTAWAADGGRVVPIPGASAVLAALVSSGIPAPRWSFEGFLPRSGRERQERLARVAGDERASVLYEAPGRTAATLRDLAAACGDHRRAAVCRELTKLHEEIRRGTLRELADGATADPPRGEVVLVVAGADSGGRGRGTSGVQPGGRLEPTTTPDAGDARGASLGEARERVTALVEGGLPRSAAARQVAAETGLPRRELFREG